METCAVNPKGSPQYWIVTGLNIAAAFVLFLFFMEVVMDNHHPLFDVGGPLGLAILFFLLPIGWVTLWRLNRRPGLEKQPSGSCYSWTNLIQGWAWLMSCLVVGTYSFIYIAFMPRPFLTSQQGPDTEESLAGFETFFGTITTGRVSNLYYRHSPDMTLFRFDLNEDKTLDILRDQLKLVPIPDPCPMNLASPPDWWVEDEPSQGAECFQHSPPGSSGITLRLHHKKSRVYFMDFRP